MENAENKKELKQNPWFYVSVTLAIVVLILAFIALKPSPTGNVVAIDDSNNNGDSGSPDRGQQLVKLTIDDDPIKGDKNAPVTIIEFSDYECPFCARFFQQTYPQIVKEYIDTGKAKLVYRDFPLGFHQNAQKAAEAAECARDLEGDDKYYEMHDKLFAEGVEGGVVTFKAYAKDMGLNQETFDQCLDSGKFAQEVKDDFQDGAEAGVQGTPTFFINGQKLVGAQPFEAFKQVIDRELGQ